MSEWRATLRWSERKDSSSIEIVSRKVIGLHRKFLVKEKGRQSVSKFDKFVNQEHFLLFDPACYPRIRHILPEFPSVGKWSYYCIVMIVSYC